MQKRIVTSALMLALLLTLALSVVAVAAPVLQDAPATDSAEATSLSGVYVSAVYPAADASGLVQVLELYENQNAQLLSFYLGEEAPVVEQGTWASEDGATVVVTLTGQGEQTYDTPSVTTYTVDGDMLADGVFMLAKLFQVTPADMDAGDAPTLPDEPPTSDDPSGVYVSSVYPAADASGMLQLLTLYADGNAQLSSIYVGKDAPIVEFGAWQLTEDSDVELTVTGTVEQAYTEPSVTTYTRGGDALDDGVFVFNLLPTVTPEELDAMTTTPAATDSAMAGVYVSPVYPAADAPGLITVLALYANGNAEQTSIYLTKGAFGEVGTWAIDAAGVLTVTMTGTPEEAYATPAVTGYAVDGETLIDGPFVLTKLPEVTPAEMDAMTAPVATPPAEEPDADASAVTAVAVYQSDVMPAASSPGRVITLTLNSDNTIVMTTDFMNDEPPIVQVGAWAEGDDGQFTVTLTGTPAETYAEPEVIVFAQEDGQLVAVEYDPAVWGEEGLTLTEVAAGAPQP
jgi:uncharacterized lipoprotein NlpE involved in copper resistance